MDEKYDKFSARHREKRAKGRVEEWMRGKNSFVGEFSEIKQILSINVLSDIYTKAPTELQLLARVKEREHKEHSEWKFQWRIIACSDCNLFIPQATSLCKLMQKVYFRCNILWLSRERKKLKTHKNDQSHKVSKMVDMLEHKQTLLTTISKRAVKLLPESINLNFELHEKGANKKCKSFPVNTWLISHFDWLIRHSRHFVTQWDNQKPIKSGQIPISEEWEMMPIKWRIFNRLYDSPFHPTNETLTYTRMQS